MVLIFFTNNKYVPNYFIIIIEETYNYNNANSLEKAKLRKNKEKDKRF
jgi:hypothetical protein